MTTVYAHSMLITHPAYIPICVAAADRSDERAAFFLRRNACAAQPLLQMLNSINKEVHMRNAQVHYHIDVRTRLSLCTSLEEMKEVLETFKGVQVSFYSMQTQE